MIRVTFSPTPASWYRIDATPVSMDRLFVCHDPHAMDKKREEEEAFLERHGLLRDPLTKED